MRTVDLDQAGIGDMTLCTVGMSLRSCNKNIDLYQNRYMYMYMNINLTLTENTFTLLSHPTAMTYLK